MSQSYPFKVYQCSLIVLMRMHHTYLLCVTTIVSVTLDSHIWPVNPVRPRDHSWTLMVMSFPTKTANGHKVAVQVMSLMCHK